MLKLLQNKSFPVLPIRCLYSEICLYPQYAYISHAYTKVLYPGLTVEWLYECITCYPFWIRCLFSPVPLVHHGVPPFRHADPPAQLNPIDKMAEMTGTEVLERAGMKPFTNQNIIPQDASDLHSLYIKINANPSLALPNSIQGHQSTNRS